MSMKVTKVAVKPSESLKLKYPGQVPFGFESTWRLVNTKLQDYYDDESHSHDGYIETKLLTEKKSFMDQYNKLTVWNEVSNDPGNIEISTKKLKTKTKLLAEFKALSMLMSKYGFIESSKSYNNNFEGGGHIHIDYEDIFGDLGYGNDYSYIDYLEENAFYRKYGIGFNGFQNLSYSKHNDYKKEVNEIFALFTHNMFTYMLNNPWLPWAFNAPVDNINAKLYTNSNFADNIRAIKEHGLQLTKKISIDLKVYALTLRPEFGTFEFRFYSMPKSSAELDYIINLSRAFHKHCFNLTMAGVKLKPIYSDDSRRGKLLKNIKISTCIKGLKNMCKDLKIDYSKIEKFGFINNLEIRYAYQKAVRHSTDASEIMLK